MFPILVTVPVRINRDRFNFSDKTEELVINASGIHSMKPTKDGVLIDCVDGMSYMIAMTMEEFVAAFHGVVATLGAYFMSALIQDCPTCDGQGLN